jgi:hypothetical protein
LLPDATFISAATVVAGRDVHFLPLRLLPDATAIS